MRINYRNKILNDLIDKYENSKAYNNKSDKRIRIKLEKYNDYNIEDYEKKCEFHNAVLYLNSMNFIFYSWKKCFFK